MKSRLASLVAALMALALTQFTGSAQNAAETKTAKLADWCTVTYPASMKLGETVQIKLDLDRLPKPNKISAHLHWMKAGGEFGGMYNYAPPQEVKGDGAYTFKYKLGPKEGMASFNMLVFLAPDGDWKNKTVEARGPAMTLDSKTADGRDMKEITAKMAAIEFKKSWIHVDAGEDKGCYEGEEWKVKVEYYLDPSEDTGSTSIKFMAVGPWVDNPDGKYTMKRTHNGYGGLSFTAAVKPGKNIIEKTFKLPKSLEYNSLLCITRFTSAEGGDWPWEIRTGGPDFKAVEKSYSLETDMPGNLFAYNEPVKINAVIKDASSSGADKQISWKATDAKGKEVASGKVPFKIEKQGQKVAIEIKTDRRGVFLVETEADGWGRRSIYFGRIPDVLAVTGGKETKFGTTFPGSEEMAKTAAKIGLTSCRMFMSLKDLAPAKGDLRLEKYDKAIEVYNKNGIKPWICICALPAWMQKGKACNQSFFPVPFDDDAWRDTVKAMAERWKGKVTGFEWLNEIVPGERCQDPVGDYLRLCKIGTETVKAVDPKFKNLLAGGLWPRNYRIALLKEGIGKYIDILSIHYGSGQGILEAREDLEVNALKHVEVWDNETAHGLSTWGVPLQEKIKPDYQCNWVLDQWTDELIVGADKIIYFGGQGDPAGNWSYMMGGMNPRPVAVTLAVMASKLHDAKPVGKFFINEKGVFHLFEKNGKPVFLASISGTSKDADFYAEDTDTSTIPVKVGSAEIIVSDYQGNETKVKSADAIAQLALMKRKVFVEGGDLETLKSYLIPSVEVTAGQMPKPFSSVTFLKNAESKISIQMNNICKAEVSGGVTALVPAGWPAQAPVQFKVKPGELQSLKFPLALGKDLADGLYPVKLVFKYDDAKLAVVEKPVNINLISPSMLGNLVKNSGFEEPGKTADDSATWSGNAKRASSEGLGVGLGKYIAKFTGGSGWQHYAQGLDNVPPGRIYLYSAWIWSTDMQAGSNVDKIMSDGTRKSMYIPSVFDAGQNSGGWKMLACHLDADSNLKGFGLVPVANGKGQALFDNMRLTVYEGTDFAAEAHKLAKPISVDGNLADWDKKCPIPLFGDNQVLKMDDSYKWSADNLSGAAYFAWDEKNLYVGMEVKDNVHRSEATNEKTTDDDSAVIAFLPGRTASPDSKAFCYYVSSAAPGGGSGKSTLFRPAEKCGGLTSGQLAKDSSVYEIAIRTEKDVTCYEIRMPLSDMGGIVPAIGTKVGMSINLNDNDGAGRKAVMKWGDGIYPGWSPKHFGLLTLVK